METKQNDFAAQVAADAAAQAHAQEIQKTRIGGLGGSDAAIVYKIGLNGLGALTATDNQRLAVMCGLTEQKDWGGNAYTNAGHAFEEWTEDQDLTKGFEREKVMSAPLAHNFKTFAHADFYKNGEVIECKFVQKPTDKVVEQYNAQLQWYYLLGAKSVTLFHGTGQADPFVVDETFLRPIERDEMTIDILIRGIAILDEALGDGWRPIMQDKVLLIDTPAVVQRSFEELERCKAEEAQLKIRKDDAQKVCKEYIEAMGLTGIVATDCEKKVQVIYTRASVTKSFDSVTFLKEHPEYNDDSRYWKTTEHKASITFK